MVGVELAIILSQKWPTGAATEGLGQELNEIILDFGI